MQGSVVSGKRKVIERNNKVVQYLPLVRRIADNIHRRLPKCVDKEDLFSLGVLGLIDAASKFDPKKNVKFRTYAEFRIRGAILDGLREMDWLSRSARHKVNEVGRAMNSLEQRVQHHVTSTDLAEHAGFSGKTINEAMAYSREVNVLSLDESHAQGFQPNECCLMDMIADTKSKSASEKMDYEEMCRIVADVIGNQLAERQKLVLTLYYYEELTMKEVAQVLGVTESRVSQIHSSAIKALKSKLASLI